MRKLLALLFLGFSAVAMAQTSIVTVSSAPSGACSGNPAIEFVLLTGAQYVCNTTWQLVPGGGITGLNPAVFLTYPVYPPGTVTSTPSGSGGTLAAGSYFFEVTALNGTGETIASPEATTTTSGTTSSVALAWTAITGATSYRVYWSTTTGTEGHYFTTATNSYTMTATGGTAVAPPLQNTTVDLGAEINAANTTLVAAGGGTIVLPNISANIATTATINGSYVSIQGWGISVSNLTCTVAGDCLVINVTAVQPAGFPASVASGFHITGNAASGQIPIHTNNLRGYTIDNVHLEGSGTSSPCLLLENTNAWVEENTISRFYTGSTCFAGIELLQDNGLATRSFGYNNIDLFANVTSGHYGIYIPNNGASPTGQLYNGSISIRGDAAGGTLFYNHSMTVGDVSYTPEDINMNVEGSSGQMWDVTAFPFYFTSSKGLYASSVPQGTSYSSSFYGPTGSYFTASSYDNSFTGIPALSAKCQNITSTSACNLFIGRDSSNYDNGILAFYYNGASSTGNELFAKVFNAPNIGWAIDGTGGFYLPGVLSAGALATDGTGKVIPGTSFSNPMTTLGDTIYGGASGAATRLAGPTTTGHTFALTDVPSGGLAVAPTWTDLATYLASPPAIGGTAAAAGTFSALTDSALTSGNCVQATTGGLLTTTGSACGTSSGTVTTTGSPASGDIAAFSGASSITTATATQVNTLIKTLTGCNTASNVYTPQGADCVAQTGGYPTAEVHTASTSASLAFTTCITSSNRDYQLRFSDLLPATTSQNLFVQVSTDGGSTWDTTSGHYINGAMQVGVNQSLAPTGFSQSNGIGFYVGGFASSSTGVVNGTMTLFNLFNSTASKHATFLMYGDGSPNSVADTGGGVYTQTAAVNAIRVISGSGNLTSGTVTCQPLP